MTVNSYRNYIGGDWAEGQDAAANVNPSDTRDVVGLYARASRTDAEAAIAAAQAAQPAWAAASTFTGTTNTMRITFNPEEIDHGCVAFQLPADRIGYARLA